MARTIASSRRKCRACGVRKRISGNRRVCRECRAMQSKIFFHISVDFVRQV